MKLGLYTAALCLAAAWAPAAAAAETLWAKAGVTLPMRDADDAACLRQADQALGSDAVDGVKSTGLGGGLVAGGLIDASVRKTTLEGCMKQKGYVAARLTPEDKRKFNALGQQDRRRWLEDFFASDRLMAAVTPLTPPLPEGDSGPIETGVFRIVPGSVKVFPGVKRMGDVVFTARGAFMNRAILKHEVRHDAGDESFTIPAGTIFYRVILDWLFTPGPITYWCGQAAPGGKNAQATTVCLANDMDGYKIEAVKYTQAEIPLTPGGRLRRARLVKPVELEPLATDDSQIVDLAYTVGPRGLRALATADGKTFETYHATQVHSIVLNKFEVDGHAFQINFMNNGLKPKFDVTVTREGRPGAVQ